MEGLNSGLKEELNRLKELRKKYEREISRFPRGCLIKKNIKGHIYYYLNYRDGIKAHFKYIGKLSSRDFKELKQKIDERNKFRRLNRQVKKDIKKIEKMVHEKKK